MKNLVIEINFEKQWNNTIDQRLRNSLERINSKRQ